VHQKLAKKEILRGRGAYKDVLEQGKKYTGKKLKIYTLHLSAKEAQQEQLKVGFSVGRVRSAVIRNRFKRLMREVVRKNKEFFFQCCQDARVSHLILMCSPSSYRTTGPPGPSYKELEEEFHMLMQQLSKQR
jgi:ribonuclease P protein component